MEQIFDLEDMLVDFSCRLMDIIEALPDTRTGIYLASQLNRLCYSPGMHHAEAQATVSGKDFIYQIGIVLKELKECRFALKIIGKKEMIKPVTKLEAIFKETQLLIVTVEKMINTSKRPKGHA